MLHEFVSSVIRAMSDPPCMRVYSRGIFEKDWHIVDILATHRRDADGHWPLWRDICITWSAQVVAVGYDFARSILREQAENPASRDHPVRVLGGRLGDWERRVNSGASSQYSASEVLAHECGHTAQARRWGGVYWAVGGAFTLFREGRHWWNWFENQASEIGLFGGIVNGSVSPQLLNPRT